MAEQLDDPRDEVSQSGSKRSGLTGKSVLLPAAATAAAAAAAGLAAKKGPDLLKKIRSEANEEGEQLGRKTALGLKERLASSGSLGKAASKFMGGGGGGGQEGKTRRLPIQRWTDVAVPVEKAYRAWTQFEEFPKFMHRVLDVEKDDGHTVRWREKIWFSTREWEAEITERRKNDRVAWKSVSGTQHSGLITFHKLDTNLTRVLVTVDFVPTGMIEKMASGMRFVSRAIQADLARFKAYVELGDAKGLEYKSKPAEMEQHREGGDDEKQDEGNREEARGRREDDNRDSDREERANRREERRKALSSS
jgi:uncharacterized membrane protein